MSKARLKTEGCFDGDSKGRSKIALARIKVVSRSMTALHKFKVRVGLSNADEGKLRVKCRAGNGKVFSTSG
jgi:hypothetical protein